MQSEPGRGGGLAGGTTAGGAIDRLSFGGSSELGAGGIGGSGFGAVLGGGGGMLGPMNPTGPGAGNGAPSPAGDALPQEHARRAAARGTEPFVHGRYPEAAAHYSEAVRWQPANADYRLKLGVSAWRAGQPAVAFTHLSEAVRLAPDLPVARDALGQLALENGDIASAVLHSGRAAELDPTDPNIAVSWAAALEFAGRADEAWAVLHPLVAGGNTTPRLAMGYARVAPRVKREADALALVEGLLWNPALPSIDRAGLHFAAAALLDRAGRYDDAFAQARQAHAADAKAFDPAAYAASVDRRISYFTPGKLHDLPRSARRTTRPVFIVGMPRSGTTLVEQILASHPEVHAAGELPVLGNLAAAAAGEPWAGGAIYPEYLESVSVRQLTRLTDRYLTAIDGLDPAARYVTDKMPHNFMYMGLIALLFPDAVVIHCTRDPRDTCLSCFMTDFAGNQGYATDLRYLGAFYRDYRRQMDHWRRTLSFPIIEVRYEETVADLEGQARRLLAFLGLPWDDRCLRFHESARSVGTASVHQVRRPIYATSVGRWRNYERHLGPLAEELGDLIE